MNDGKMENLGEKWVRKIKWRTQLMDRCKAISLKGLRGGERFAMLKLKRKHHLHRRKIQNIVNEMHKKDALRLINDNDVIVLPKLRVKGILKKEGGIGQENNRFIFKSASGSQYICDKESYGALGFYNSTVLEDYCNKSDLLSYLKEMPEDIMSIDWIIK